jgi:excisionase family DNA binding protein
MEIELGGLLWPKQAAKLLGKSRMTIFRYIKDGKLTPVIVGGKRMLSRSQVEGLRDLEDSKESNT